MQASRNVLWRRGEGCASGGQDGPRSVSRNGIGIWGDQEWAKKRPYLGNRRGSNGKGMGKPRREAGWRQGGGQEQPSRGQEEGDEGVKKGSGQASDWWHSEASGQVGSGSHAGKRWGRGGALRCSGWQSDAQYCHENKMDQGRRAKGANFAICTQRFVERGEMTGVPVVRMGSGGAPG